MKIAIGVIVVLLIILGFWYVGSRDAEPVPGEENTEEMEDMNMEEMENMDMQEADDTAEENTAAGDEAEGEVVEIAISGENFSFSEEEIRVNQGDTVRVTFTNTGGTHDWNLEGYDVGTEIIETGESETVEFVADEAGTFAFYCSVGNHRAMGMEGTFIVE